MRMLPSFSVCSSEIFKETDILSPPPPDTYAVAGMALQCVKDSGSYTHNAAEIDLALSKIKQKLLASRRTDGHMGNEFSTGLAVQVRPNSSFWFI